MNKFENNIIKMKFRGIFVIRNRTQFFSFEAKDTVPVYRAIDDAFSFLKINNLTEDFKFKIDDVVLTININSDKKALMDEYVATKKAIINNSTI